MKAWTCHGRNQRELVDHLRQAQIIQSPAVQHVMEQIDRAHYCPTPAAYQDAPQPIGHGQTISAPHMHAHALEELYQALSKRRQQTTAPLNVLDVGCGSGYLTACLGQWMQSSSSLGPGRVFGMDIHSFLVEQTRHNLQKHNGDLLNNDIIQLQVANGWEGWPSEAPFDAIHVGAAAETFPWTLARQLQSDGGVMIVPIASSEDNSVQHLYRVVRCSETDESGEEFRVTQLLGVRYVPLVQPPSREEKS
ncbi:protein-L-isoaspartate(D-aspartate) O-methyltransferase [Fistulifera solaris]|uniref:protein-L-isoaspartate(D-aspartate) O-methyltransferase n=1 Tax=Fistulifera solaris TaxID=1519565 RepID=A0A1Z5JMX6_FISSO|nr:protein-L-isoaspartate(D-aspartate) O-methyltransferase [Fistulifera solaris]|eukprot:GAX15212.1 protein-L-isoaspartate(D-aspartate) O-methyltransferase [Fistulifera solaris]